MKIDNVLNFQYDIPGPEELSGAVGMDEASSFQSEPHGAAQPMSLPAPGGWKEVLGLNRSTNNATGLEPPKAPSWLDSDARLQAENEHRQLLQNHRVLGASASASPKFQRMIHLLAARQAAQDIIRARSLKGAVR